MVIPLDDYGSWRERRSCNCICARSPLHFHSPMLNVFALAIIRNRNTSNTVQGFVSSGAFPLLDAPDDILTVILSKLDVKSLCMVYMIYKHCLSQQVARTCKTLRDRVQDDNIWKLAALGQWPTILEVIPDGVVMELDSVNGTVLKFKSIYILML